MEVKFQNLCPKMTFPSPQKGSHEYHLLFLSQSNPLLKNEDVVFQETSFSPRKLLYSSVNYLWNTEVRLDWTDLVPLHLRQQALASIYVGQISLTEDEKLSRIIIIVLVLHWRIVYPIPGEWYFQWSITALP